MNDEQDESRITLDRVRIEPALLLIGVAVAADIEADVIEVLPRQRDWFAEVAA